MPPFDSAIDISLLWPEIILLSAACGLLLLGQAAANGLRRSVPMVALLAIIAALAIVRFWPPDATAGGGLAFDSLAQFVRLSTLVLGLVLILVAWAQPQDDERGEFFAMMLFSLTGLMLVGSADDLVMLFLAVELVSIPTYVMVTISRREPLALEAGTKYFYLGALSAAVMAYGFSFLYGVSGSASLPATVDAVSDALAQPGTTAHTVATLGLILSIAGLLFKIAAVPFHFYIADVYHGAAAPVAGFLGFVPKLAGMIAIFKIVALTEWATTSGGLFWMIWIVAACSMTVGNVLALRQKNIKRMLAYSGIAHAGYMFVALLAGPAGGRGIMGDGTAAILYYVVIYGIANLGAFALLGLLQVRGRPCETVRDVAGLLRHSPGLALLMALSMFTLMGMPPTPGFWGKMGLFGSTLSAAQQADGPTSSWIIALVIIAVLNTAIAAAYYLRVIAALLLYESDEPAEPAPREAQHMGAVLCGFLLLIFAFVPGVLMDAGRLATRDLRDDLVWAPATEFATADPPRDLVARTIPDSPQRGALDPAGANER